MQFNKSDKATERLKDLLAGEDGEHQLDFLMEVAELDECHAVWIPNDEISTFQLENAAEGAFELVETAVEGQKVYQFRAEFSSSSYKGVVFYVLAGNEDEVLERLEVI